MIGLRSLAVLLLALLAAPALAGCAGETASGATVLEHREAAEDRAAQWDEQARLSKVTGVEGRHAEHVAGDERLPEEEPFWAPAANDSDVGDGRSAVWAYEFASPSQSDTVLQVAVDAAGTVVSTSTEPRKAEDQPLPAGVLDSDEAAEIAKQANAELREGLQKSDPGVSLHLVHEEDHGVAVWRVSGGGEQSGGTVTLDARSGEVLETHP